NGGAVPDYEQGKKDVVLVMPQQYVEFITKFEDFADDSIPYMYHCHLLHHEDDGMMGSFRVLDTTSTGINDINFENNFSFFPNPTSDFLNIISSNNEKYSISIFNSLGEKIYSEQVNKNLRVETSNFASGIYFIQLKTKYKLFTQKLIKQ
ncbi:MAG: T9SS type A sorting domain-containing protein, partial [Bacteroidota bacterium]